MILTTRCVGDASFGFTIAAAVAGLALTLYSCSGCTPAERATAVTEAKSLAPAIGGALCAAAADQPAEPSWELLVCDVLGDKEVQHVTLLLPREQAEMIRTGASRLQ